ncbi:MAG: tripartite tricarboxylate transporter substrate binding protein [Burkholderiales bacterium]|nr:tripartite tricarboxylate transporter substrate binding protein [Burkholderiales bacterium]
MRHAWSGVIHSSRAETAVALVLPAASILTRRSFPKGGSMTMQPSLTSRFLLAAAAALAVTALSATAQEYPNRPLRLIVPVPPGGTTDTLARVVAPALQERLKQAVVVENRPGAGSVIGIEAVARSPADGYTLLFGGSDGMAVLPSVKKKVPYDPVKDLTSVGFLAFSPLVLVVNAKMPVKSFAEFVEYARARPGKLHYGSSGFGSILHMGMELIELQARVDAAHVPFQGGGPALQALVAGQLDLMMMGPTGMAQRAEAGQLRILGQTGSTRLAVLPNVPTMRELGTEITVTSWFGVLGPAGLAQPIVLRLNREIASLLAQPAVQKRFIDVGCEPETMSPEAFSQFIAAENRKWVQVVKSARIELID